MTREARNTPEGWTRIGAKVLVVDDEPAVRRMAYHLLSELGYRVFEAGDAAEALAVLGMPGRVDLVLCDVVMPRVDGVTLLREIRTRWPGQPVVLMSAHPAEVMVQHGLAEADAPFLSKPFTRGELAGIVAEELARRPGQPRRSPAGEERRS
jgi:CheY-like chemotaxis protein